MGYVLSPAPPPWLNLDRFGMPKDYATYEWVMYRKRVRDDSPERRAFLNGGVAGLVRQDLEPFLHPLLGTQSIRR